MLELADEVGHALPPRTAEALGALVPWRRRRRARSSGTSTTFEHTLAVMQRADHLRRVAREAVVDLAADGVVHAELRYAPELHQRGGLTRDEVVGAVADGLAEGVGRGGRGGTHRSGWCRS